MGLDLSNLRGVTEFIRASGAVERPLGITRAKIIFTLSRGNAKKCRAEIPVTIVNTLAYDTLLGMDFITAMGGAYDTYSEMFKYRWVSTHGDI